MTTPVKKVTLPIATVAVALCSGCSAPQFDVPYEPNSGQPTITSIISRVKCELTDLVRDPLPQVKNGITSSANTWHELFLLNGDYDVVVTLTLEVNNSGGLTPSITFMEPVTKLISFAAGGSATLSESRDSLFTDNFQISMRQLYADSQMASDPSQALDKNSRDELSHKCPTEDTNLAGVLNIKDFVSGGVQTERLPVDPAPTGSAATQAFGGTVSFVVTKNVSGAGPTWSTTRWKGPGGLLGFSHVNTDKITFSFAKGPNAGTAIKVSEIKPNPPNAHAFNFLQQQIAQSINSQLQSLVAPAP